MGTEGTRQKSRDKNPPTTVSIIIHHFHPMRNPTGAAVLSDSIRQVLRRSRDRWTETAASEQCRSPH